MYSGGLINSPSENVSVRLSNDITLLTPGGVMKFGLNLDQLIIVNLDGEKVGPHNDVNRELKSTLEFSMHLEVDRHRADVGCVVHAHTSHAAALTVAGLSVCTQLLTKGMLFLGVVSNAPYGVPTTKELSDSIIEFISDHDAIMLRCHDSITFGMMSGRPFPAQKSLNGLLKSNISLDNIEKRKGFLNKTSKK